MSIFSDNFKKARKSKGWSQDQAANVLQIKRSRLGSYEDGRAHPPYELFIIIVDVFGIRDWKGFINNVDFDINKQVMPPPPPSIVDRSYRKADEKTRNLVKQLLSLP